MPWKEQGRSKNVPSNPGSGSQAASLSGDSDPVEKGQPTVSPNQLERESRFDRRIRRGIAQPRSDVPSVKRRCTVKRSGLNVSQQPECGQLAVSPDQERAPYELIRDKNIAANAVILQNLGIANLFKAMR